MRDAQIALECGTISAFKGVHLFDGEGITDDVLREPFEIFSLVGLNALASVNVEA